MTKHPIALSPDEVRRVLDLKPGTNGDGEDSLDFRDFPKHPLDGVVMRGCDVVFQMQSSVDDTTDAAYPSPLGEPGDVLVCPVICVDDDRQYRPMPPPEHSYGESPTYSFRLTVVSATPRRDGKTWVVDAVVGKDGHSGSA